MATAFPVANASLVNGVGAMLGTESIVMLVRGALKRPPSSVSADFVTSARGTGSAAATPQQTNREATTMTTVRKIVPTNTASQDVQFVAAMILRRRGDCGADILADSDLLSSCQLPQSSWLARPLRGGAGKLNRSASSAASESLPGSAR